MILSHVFLSNLHNIGLYIYIVRYKSDIKIPGFLRNISKKISKHLKKLLNQFPFSKKTKKKHFVFIRPNPKNFPSMFSLKDCIFFMF